MDVQPGTPFRPPVDEVAALVTEWYDLGKVTEVCLYRAWTNAVYEVTTSGGRYVLKCYRPGWRTLSEIGWEIDLLDHLARRGARVALAIRSRNGEAVVPLRAGPDAPLAVLFVFAAGEKPEPPFPPELYEREGRAVAELHAALDTFRSQHHRPALDLVALLDRPLAHIIPLVTDATSRRELLAAADVLRNRISALAAQGLDWGPCHGDLTFDNLHLTSEGEFVWYDFDSGGPGWRALDIQGWSAFEPAWRPLGDAFVAGYRAVRPLSDANLAAAPLLTLTQDVWGLSLDLRYHVDRQDDRTLDSHLGTAIGGLIARFALID